MDDPPYVLENAPAFLDSRDDRREVVVREDHVARLFRDIGARYAHRYADVSLFERWRVVDSVAGHRDSLSALLPRPHDLQLVLRVYSCVDLEPGQLLHELVVGHPVELFTCNSEVMRAVDAELFCYGHGSRLVVAGYHQGRYPG